jgi:CRP/FNR family transcriptional regulator, anaerobic regulatory protein
MNYASTPFSPALSTTPLLSFTALAKSPADRFTQEHATTPEWLVAFSPASRRVARRQALYRRGDVFRSLFVIRYGTFKTGVTLEDGREQVTGFRVRGELLGLDGIGDETCCSDAIALEASEVYVLPYHAVLLASVSDPSMTAWLQRSMSQEIMHDQSLMLLLGTLSAKERLAHFLLSLSARFAARGYSASCFVLRMTREDIGAYLGLRLETVSRELGRMQDAGLIKIERSRELTLNDVPGLRAFGRGGNSTSSLIPGVLAAAAGPRRERGRFLRARLTKIGGETQAFDKVLRPN